MPFDILTSRASLIGPDQPRLIGPLGQLVLFRRDQRIADHLHETWRESLDSAITVKLFDNNEH